MDFLVLGCLIGGLIGIFDGRLGFIVIAIGALLKLVA
jgi:hypothetical protein